MRQLADDETRRVAYASLKMAEDTHSGDDDKQADHLNKWSEDRTVAKRRGEVTITNADKQVNEFCPLIRAVTHDRFVSNLLRHCGGLAGECQGQAPRSRSTADCKTYDATGEEPALGRS